MKQLLTGGKIHMPHGFRRAGIAADSGRIVSIGVGIPFFELSIVVFYDKNNCIGLHRCL